MTETVFVGEALPEIREDLPDKPKTAIFGFAGYASGGSNNAQYEDMLKTQFGSESVMTVSSASTKFAFDNELGLSGKTFRSNEYYRTMAARAVEKFADHDVYLIHCQSGGGIEGLEFARALLDNDKFKAKKISFLFTGVPGFAEHQAGRLRRGFEFLGRFIRMGIKRAENQHFDLCPPPEEYYAYQEGKQPAWKIHSEKTETVYQDNPETRSQRRKKFYDQYMSFLKPEEKTAITRKLTGLDKAIITATKKNDTKTGKELKHLMDRRAKLVYGIGGDRYYNEYLANKPEYKNVPNSGFDGVSVGALYLVRMFSSVCEGMEKRLGNVVQHAQEKGVEAHFSFGLLEKDEIIKTADILHMEERLDNAGLKDQLVSWLAIEGLSHESVDNSPQGIFKAILNMKNSLQETPAPEL